MRGNHLVREARRRAGLTQAELAERAGTTQSAIARLERGVGSPTLERISELVQACGLEVQVRLVEEDVDGWTQVRIEAARPASERVATGVGAARLAQQLQAAGRRARR